MAESSVPTQTPATEAGRALLKLMNEWQVRDSGIDLTPDILAIEEEAAALEREKRVAVEDELERTEAERLKLAGELGYIRG